MKKAIYVVVTILVIIFVFFVLYRTAPVYEGNHYTPPVVQLNPIVQPVPIYPCNLKTDKCI